MGAVHMQRVKLQSRLGAKRFVDATDWPASASWFRDLVVRSLWRAVAVARVRFAGGVAVTIACARSKDGAIQREPGKRFRRTHCSAAGCADDSLRLDVWLSRAFRADPPDARPHATAANPRRRAQLGSHLRAGSIRAVSRGTLWGTRRRLPHRSRRRASSSM